LTRRVPIAALVVPALLVVAIAARSYQPLGGDPGGERAASSTFLDSVFTVVLMLGAAMLLVALWIRVSVLKKPGSRSNTRLSSLVMFLIVIVALVGVRQILEYERRPPNAEGADVAVPQQLPPGKPVPEPELGRSPRVVWPLAIGIGGVIAAAIVIAVILEHRRRADALTPEQLQELRAALDEAIEDLRRDPDPRRAVVAAYARMEQALSVYGLPRKPAEAPYEYLRRVGRELEAEEPVAALTELFEVAKFSEHSVDETMRGRAIDALTAVRREVRTAAT
jgi:ribosomal protein S13